MLSARKTLSTNTAVALLKCDEQLAMSPAPIMTDAPLSATMGAADAAGGGVNWTGGLHARVVDAATSVAYDRNCMMIP
jgi:hypothetical protein